MSAGGRSRVNGGQRWTTWSPTLAPVDPERRLRAERLLRRGERLLWVGAPDPAVRFTAADGFLVPFSLMWGGFAIFWEAAAFAGGTPFFFKLWGIPFVLVGVYFIAGRFVVKARRKRQRCTS